MGKHIRVASQKTLPTAWAIARAFIVDHQLGLVVGDGPLLLGFIRNRRLDLIISHCDVVASEFRDAYQSRLYFQIAAFFRKNASFSDEATCTNAARGSFERAERLCRITNKRLCYYDAMHDRNPFRAEVNAMRRELYRVLGDVPDVEAIFTDGFRLTSGATATRPRSISEPYRKVSKDVDVTIGAAKVLATFWRPSGAPVRFSLTACNRIALVPKNYKTHRTIACEPTGNLPLQLACDRFLKNRLNRCLGIDLSCQTRNQEMARIGSITGEFATVDFSMASDTFSLELIHHLFPPAWAKLFMSLRSPCYTGVFGDGQYAKLSSMGNGFTFPLETLLFAVACKAIGSKLFSVYGDDVCLETHLCDRYLLLTKYLGFIPNREKTFQAGPFRESCGKDYLMGVDVRPFFVKCELDAVNRRDLCHNINGLIALSWTGSALRNICEGVIRSFGLPLTCVSEDTGSGIHVSVTDAYRLRLVHYCRADGLTYVKSLVEAQTLRKAAGVRQYVLWHIQANATPIREQALVTSDVASHTKIVRVRTPWRLPRFGIPSYLFDMDGVIAASYRPG